jgi:hypothetical protein
MQSCSHEPEKAAHILALLFASANARFLTVIESNEKPTHLESIVPCGRKVDKRLLVKIPRVPLHKTQYLILHHIPLHNVLTTAR